MIAGRGYVFGGIQKTGTLAMRHWLQKHYQGKRIGPYHSFYVPPPHDRKFRFLTVRNPYDRMRSLWRVTRDRDGWLSFEHMCRHYHEFSLGQSEIVDRFKPDMILRNESLADEVKRLPFYKAESGEPGIMRPTDATHPKYTLTEDDRAVVADVFAADFEVLEYPR